MARLPEVEKAMIEFSLARAEDASLGLTILPGVQQLLQTLQVCMWMW